MSNETGSKLTRATGNLPVIYVPQADPRQSGRYAMPASFASQLMASKQRLSGQARRSLTAGDLASDAYTKGGRIAVKRMPNGYVRTLVV